MNDESSNSTDDVFNEKLPDKLVVTKYVQELLQKFRQTGPVVMVSVKLPTPV